MKINWFSLIALMGCGAMAGYLALALVDVGLHPLIAVPLTMLAMWFIGAKWPFPLFKQDDYHG